MILLEEGCQMISCPYSDLIGTQSTVNTDTLLETFVILIKCTEQGFILRSDALIGVATISAVTYASCPTGADSA